MIETVLNLSENLDTAVFYGVNNTNMRLIKDLHPSVKLMGRGDVLKLAGSDADVAAHAACDALLIASGVGDLGTVFGTDQPEWAGASGAALLQESVRLVREEGWQIANVSIQIVGQRPRFLPR